MVFGVIDPAIGGLGIAVITALATYLVAARSLSGKIKNSDAQELWAESRSIREWSMDRVKELDEHIKRLEDRLVEVEKANTKLASEHRKCQRELYEARNRIHVLQTENVHLTGLLDDERALVERLKWESENAPRRRASDPPIENGEEARDAGRSSSEGGKDDRRGS